MNAYDVIYKKIKEIANKYSNKLNSQFQKRVAEMQNDDKSHHLIYRVLGIPYDVGNEIDYYQNQARFLYKYAGSFLEEVTILCFKEKYPFASKTKVKNTISNIPKTFEIDCLVNNNAYEIKWRDATTDNDHIIKEHTRVKTLRSYNYKPIRIMFYYPNRVNSMRIQETLETLYKGVGGEYYYGDSAWSYVKKTTGVDLLNILEKIAKERENND
ncbi:ApaLI family restriction endonuclease [Mycoplasma mycoides]|nr:ApaLI family restriction endonuclease [Mycoplasma mycoides]